MSEAERRILVEAINYWLQHTDPDEIPLARRDEAARLLDRITACTE